MFGGGRKRGGGAPAPEASRRRRPRAGPVRAQTRRRPLLAAQRARSPPPTDTATDLIAISRLTPRETVGDDIAETHVNDKRVGAMPALRTPAARPLRRDVVVSRATDRRRKPASISAPPKD
ncbi:hypothetical protein EVAR_54039_1 [Eumeta japonica]|uniref:Uncharacterized protein n=1 Tax=Eumeta variegata TaxID=151549 RepID=A0A4C1YSQ5_EUMVA|nr:hypothetical protein EVAR_54039_1 [Eumeta japonica]